LAIGPSENCLFNLFAYLLFGVSVLPVFSFLRYLYILNINSLFDE
jgi:hypothetical protein